MIKNFIILLLVKIYNLNKFSIKLIKMSIDGKVAINSINEVIQTINDKKATVAD